MSKIRSISKAVCSNTYIFKNEKKNVIWSHIAAITICCFSLIKVYGRTGCLNVTIGVFNSALYLKMKKGISFTHLEIVS